MTLGSLRSGNWKKGGGRDPPFDQMVDSIEHLFEKACFICAFEPDVAVWSNQHHAAVAWAVALDHPGLVPRFPNLLFTALRHCGGCPALVIC